MLKLPEKLNDKLNKRKQDSALRILPVLNNSVDFASNDYLGFAKSAAIFNQTHQFLIENDCQENGATGSRLLSGNHPLYQSTENHIAKFHQAESALVFNSGYDANVGFFSSVPQKGDFILYDELCHASIRDGIRLTNAKSFKYQHNDFEDLERLLNQYQPSTDNRQLTTVYVVTESVFSMDGDTPNLEELVHLAGKYEAHIVIDEAHALGVFGNQGEGLVQSLQLQDKIFARIVTFGKGLGCHGAAILGSQKLKEYLVNFARSFIYTTGLSPHAIATIYMAYQVLQQDQLSLEKLRNNINIFNQQKQLMGLKPLFVRSKSAIQSAIIPGNEKVKTIALQLQQKGFDVKAILSPTVPESQERLRFCIHSYNTSEEISSLMACLQSLL